MAVSDVEHGPSPSLIAYIPAGFSQLAVEIVAGRGLPN
jgi:hypothetical protein